MYRSILTYFVHYAHLAHFYILASIPHYLNNYGLRAYQGKSPLFSFLFQKFLCQFCLFYFPHELQGRIVKFHEKSCWDSDWNESDSQIYYKFMGRAIDLHNYIFQSFSVLSFIQCIFYVMFCNFTEQVLHKFLQIFAQVPIVNERFYISIYKYIFFLLHSELSRVLNSPICLNYLPTNSLAISM